MKERVTKFDLENAFKALDEIAIPKVGKVRPNRPDLKESVKRVDRTSMLVEDYYDLYNREDVNELKEDREAEIASAKLAKIEKIVDLDAESPEDLQPTYIGKTIIQCPQCLTLFYKDPADIVVSEENPDMVNVDEICQHCGNDSGYTVIGKVAEEEVPVDELPPEAIPEENEAEETEEDIPMADEEPAEESADSDLDLEAAPDESVEEAEEQEDEEVQESVEEEKKESLEKTVADDLKDVRVDAAKGEVKKLEENLNEAKTKKVYNTYTNIMWDLVGGRVEKDEKGRNFYSQGCGYTEYDTGIDKDDNITVYAKTKEGLNNAIEVAKKYNHEYLGPMEAGHKRPGYYMITIIIKPEDYEDGAFEESLNLKNCSKRIVESASFGFAVKSEDWPEIYGMAGQLGIKTVEDLGRFMQEEGKGKDIKTALFDYLNNELENLDFVATESCKKPLKEEDDLSDAEFEQLLNSDEFKTPISETEVEAYLDESKEEVKFDEIEDFQEQLFNEHVTKYLNEVYSNVESFETTNCALDENKFIVEGNIKFKSGKTKKMSFDFKAANKGLLEGYSKNIPVESKFTLKYNINKDKALVTESLAYKYKINGTEVSGETK